MTLLRLFDLVTDWLIILFLAIVGIYHLYYSHWTTALQCFGIASTLGGVNMILKEVRK